MGRPARVLLVVALAVLVAHTALLADWVVDDAGISFAYARNLARGAGLVSQPGVEPVEGYSNPLWTLALASFFRLGFFHPVWTVKLLSLLLIGLSFLLIARTAPEEGIEAWLVASAPLLLALNTSFVVWTMSGLENPLLVFLVSVSATLAFRITEDDTRKTAVLGGVVSGLITLTRPEGAAYAVCFGLLLLLGTRRSRLDRFVSFASAASLVVLPYVAFRRIYFHDWVPNTFHAKVRPWLMSSNPDRLMDLLSSAAGSLTLLVSGAIAAALVRALLKRAKEGHVLILGMHLLTAAGVYILLPPDWMGEYRFATPFFLFLFWLTGFAMADLFSLLRSRAWRAGFAVPLIAVLLLVEATRVHADRSMDFARSPTEPFARIMEFGEAYNNLAALLPEGKGSLLVPDLGGTLFTSTRLRLYDLAGLCDRTVARTLMDDTGAFHDYVFQEVRPTFIHVHKSWAGWAAFHKDPRFLRDYVALHEDWQGGESGEPGSGDYVRRDALREPTRLVALRAEFLKLGLDRPLP